MKKKILLLLLIIVFVYSAGGVSYYFLTKEKEEEVINVSDLETIKNYDYTLKSNDTTPYKEIFNELKTVLEKDEVSDDDYASNLAKLFIIDLYTLSNKINKYDVRSAIFVHPDYVQNYKLNVQNTLYKYMEDNSHENRTQELPEVATIEIKESEKTNYKIGDNSLNGYKISLEWSYVKDLGYDTKGVVTLVKVDNKYYVVQKD